MIDVPLCTQPTIKTGATDRRLNRTRMAFIVCLILTDNKFTVKYTA